MLNPQVLQNGEEQYEKFKASRKLPVAYQYDYRDTDGELFSCVKKTLEACRQAKDAWVSNRKAETTEINISICPICKKLRKLVPKTGFITKTTGSDTLYEYTECGCF